MIDKEKLTEVIGQALEGTDLFLVEASVSAQNVVTVTIDSMAAVSLEHCMALDRAIHAAFDADADDYELTVGSYGISEPYRVLRHYEKNVGGPVEVLTADSRKLKGVLKEATGEGIVLTVQQKVLPEGKKRPVLADVDVPLSYSDIRQAKSIIEI